jgi:hypothetical protein
MLQDQGHTKEHERTARLLVVAVLVLGAGLRAWMALVQPRYFDDHYVFNNIASFLNGSLRPRHSYYGTLSYLPQALALKVCDFLHSRTGIAALAVHGAQFEGFTLGAFRIMRTFIVLYALLSIWMIYLVGRCLFSPTVGLAAAAVLAAYPQHLRSSVQLKPDMMALMFTLVTLYWTAGAARSPRLSRFLLSGVGVGLAASAKYIGVAAAIPLTVWALWAGLRDRRLWAWLLLSGMTSVATFFVLNPFFGSVLHFGSRLVSFYGARAHAEQSGHLVVLRGELEFLAYQHGWFLGALLLLGTLFLVRRLRPRSESFPAAVLPLSLFVGYPAVHALGMTLFYPHNLLPSLGGTALVCACGMVRCGRWLKGRRATVLVWLFSAGFLLVRPFHYAYSRLVPDTWKVAEDTLRVRLVPLRTRHVIYEPADRTLKLSESWQHAAMTEAPSLAALPASSLDLADAEVFPLARTQGPGAAFYRDRRRGPAPERALEIRARPFRSQGTPLLLLLHPWMPAGDAIPVGVRRSGAPGLLIARLPSPLAAGDVLSIELWRPAADESTVVLLQPGRQRIPLLYAGSRSKRAVRFLTPRFRYAAGVAEIQIPASVHAYPKNFRVQLWRWTNASRGEPGAAPALTPSSPSP